MKKLEEMTIEELKALAYDEGKKFEIARQNLVILNKRINELEQAKKSAPEKPPKKGEAK